MNTLTNFIVVLLIASSAMFTQAESSDNDTPTIAFYLQNNVELLDFAGPMEVFAVAGFKVFTVSKTKDPIVSQRSLTIIPDYSLADAPQADILAVFGGRGVATSKDKEIIEWVKRQQKHTEYNFSVCTGAFILAEAGVLDGLTATTYHRSIKSFTKKYPQIKVLSDVRFVDNGPVITTAGISAGIDGALHLVSKIKSKKEAQRIARYMEYDKWQPNEGMIVSQN